MHKAISASKQPFFQPHFSHPCCAPGCASGRVRGSCSARMSEGGSGRRERIHAGVRLICARRQQRHDDLARAAESAAGTTILIMLGCATTAADRAVCIVMHEHPVLILPGQTKPGFAPAGAHRQHIAPAAGLAAVVVVGGCAVRRVVGRVHGNVVLHIIVALCPPPPEIPAPTCACKQHAPRCHNAGRTSGRAVLTIRNQ